MQLKKIHVDKFRHMQNLDIDFGESLTVISGQNGTGKSTILGLAGQLFDYKGEKTINNKNFATKYSEIFRFCPTHEYSSSHEYHAIIETEDGDIEKEVKSRFVKKENRFRLDIGDRSGAGKGAINHPVIYLGLRRLFPIAQEKDGSVKVNSNSLSDKEKKFFNKYAREILMILDKEVSAQDVKTPNKEFLGMETSRYSIFGNSAGQDNLGQILTSIISFTRLKTNKKDYSGGILLIDEIDSTLYPGSQINLIKYLYKFSKLYDLQIIFTTHSLDILEYIKAQKDWNVKINFFENKGKSVRNVVDPSLDYIRDNILVQTKREDDIEKTFVLCEDDVTEAWCKNLLNGIAEKKKVLIKKGPMGAGDLKMLASKKHPFFKKMIFALDGDYSQNSKFKNINRIIFLPGDSLPEKFLYNYLDSLDDEDDFWDNDNHFTKQVCFRDFIQISDKGEYKNWMKDKKNNFGGSYSKLFNKWKKDNPDLTKSFQENFIKELNKIRNE